MNEADQLKLENAALRERLTRSSEASLRIMERLRADFLGMVSHELRTPLAAIKGSTTTLPSGASDFDPAVMTQFHRIMDQQVDHVQT